jgi:nucleoside diphosphate kinase
MASPVGSWTYALVTPDGLVTESLPWIVEKLRSSGLQPVAGRLVRLETATMLRIYETLGPSRPLNLPPRRAFELWYGLGPGCILLLHHDGLDATAAMLAVKGAMLPDTASPDSIRYAGENGLMNLVHCPDDEATAAEELALLLGPKFARDMQRLAMNPNERIRHLTVDSLDDALPMSRGSKALSLPLIVNRIRLRLVQHLAIDGSSDDSVLSVLMETAWALHDERHEIVKMSASSGRAAVARAHNGHLHGRLMRVTQKTQNTAIEKSLLGLRALLERSQNDRLGTLAAIGASGIYVSDAESAVLELSTYV